MSDAPKWPEFELKRKTDLDTGRELVELNTDSGRPQTPTFRMLFEARPEDEDQVEEIAAARLDEAAERCPFRHLHASGGARLKSEPDRPIGPP